MKVASDGSPGLAVGGRDPPFCATSSFFGGSPVPSYSSLVSILNSTHLGNMF